MIESLLEAKSLMTSALEILDRIDAPAHVGAQLDLAINSLAEVCVPLIGQTTRAEQGKHSDINSLERTPSGGDSGEADAAPGN